MENFVQACTEYLMLDLVISNNSTTTVGQMSTGNTKDSFMLKIVFNFLTVLIFDIFTEIYFLLDYRRITYLDFRVFQFIRKLPPNISSLGLELSFLLRTLQASTFVVNQIYIEDHQISCVRVIYLLR
jgi:hypothetical protein